MPRLFALLVLLGLGLLVARAPARLRADDPPPVAASSDGRQADQAALRPFAGLVGQWRGTGQVRRGSARGSWTESADWAWELANDRAALRVKLEDGKHLRTARLAPDSDTDGTFVLEAELPDGSRRAYRGRPDDRGRLVLDSEPEDGLDPEVPTRITLTPLHDARHLVLLEALAPGSNAPRRLGEVGFTRQGAAFAAGDSYPECIVTGGRGTTRVSHKGQEYFVCCSGCKDLFDADPEAILAEAEARRASNSKGK